MGENQLRSAIYVFPAKRLYIFSINTRHITKAQTFFSVVFSRQKTWYIFRSKPNTIWKRRLFSIRLERFLVKILICKFIECSLPGNYLKKTLVSPFKSANCLISNFVFYTTIALISRLRVLSFLYISGKRIINFFFKSISMFFSSVVRHHPSNLQLNGKFVLNICWVFSRDYTSCIL